MLLAMLFLGIMSMEAKNEKQPTYLYGFATSFNDSTVYFAEIQLLDNAWVDSKTKFDEAGLVEVRNNFFRTYENVYNFFSLYANTDGLSVEDLKNIGEVELEKIDKWLYSRLNTLVKNYYQEMEKKTSKL